MMRKTLVAVALSALACVAVTSSASAKHHTKHPVHAAQPSTAETIPGVNPMTNAGATPAVSQPTTYAPIDGVNPMTNAPAIP